LKITYLYQYFGTPSGSWSTRVYELTKRWVEAGVEVTVISAPYDKSDIQANGLVSNQTIDGINLIIIDSGDSNRLPKWKRVLKALQFSVVATYCSLRLSSDLVIASSGPITIGIPGIITKWLKRIPMVFEVRDLWPDGGIEMGLIKGRWIIATSRWFESKCYANAALIVPCSSGMEYSIKQRFPKKATLTIPNACDVILFQEETSMEFPTWYTEDSKLLLYTGSLGLMDSCMEIVEGFSKLEKRKDIHIVFIGEGSEREALQKRTKDLGLTSHIHYTGLIPKNEVVAWYKKAIASFVVFKDYAVLSTSSPNKMFDSFAAGVPIIQNTKGWIMDLVKDEGCGINVAPNNKEEMAAAIQRMITEVDFQKSSGENALRLAKSKFSRDQLAKEYLTAIAGLSSEK
jgi:glycosyltransferase involved in cell wall biosynthesis